MIELPLSQGYIALIDDIDEDLAYFKWSARPTKWTVYAFRNMSRKLTIPRRSILLHRVILSRILGRDLLPDEEVDHIHHNGLDNRRFELRLATSSTNQMNTRLGVRNQSGYKGVSWNKSDNRWAVFIDHKFLGNFVDIIEAARAYDRKAIELFGEFANTNFPREDYK